MSPQEKALYHDKADRLRNITTVNRSSPTTSRSSADCGVSLSSLGAGLPSVNNPWNPEVRHAVAEYIIEDRDFPTPNPNELIERSQIAIASEYSNLDSKYMIFLLGTLPLGELVHKGRTKGSTSRNESAGRVGETKNEFLVEIS